MLGLRSPRIQSSGLASASRKQVESHLVNARLSLSSSFTRVCIFIVQQACRTKLCLEVGREILQEIKKLLKASANFYDTATSHGYLWHGKGQAFGFNVVSEGLHGTQYLSIQHELLRAKLLASFNKELLCGRRGQIKRRLSKDWRAN